MKNPKTKAVGDSLRVALRGATQNDNIKKETGGSFTPPSADFNIIPSRLSGGKGQNRPNHTQNIPKTGGKHGKEKNFFKNLLQFHLGYCIIKS